MTEFIGEYWKNWVFDHWLRSVPLIKMMQCAVTRRRMTSRRKANLVHDPRAPGLATLITVADQQKELCEASQSESIWSSSLDASVFGKVTANVPGTRGDGHGKEGYGEGCLSSGPLQMVGLVNNSRHHPYSKVAEIREARRASTDRNVVTRKHIAAPASFTFSPFGRQRVVPEKLTADDASGKFAYISLDGRLVNAELATSAINIGGDLGAEEAQAWEDFAPMYRVLIVALSAAAASAAKDKNSVEIQSLLKMVTEQEKELVILRQQLSDQLSFQSITNCNSLPTKIGETFQGLKKLEHPEVGDEGCLKFGDTDKSVNVEIIERADVNNPIELRIKLRTQLDLGLKLDMVSEDSYSSRGDAKNNNLIVETPSRYELTNEYDFRSVHGSTSSLEKCAESEAKWYVNPMVDAAEDYYDMCTPERVNSIFAACTPLREIRGSYEWTTFHSSLKARNLLNSDFKMPPLAEVTPASPLKVIPCRLSKESVTPVSDNTCVDEEVSALRVECAGAMLKLKTKVMTTLKKEAARCISERSVSSTEVKIIVAALLSAVAGCWRDTVPQALAALGLSPSEYNSCLVKNTQRKNPAVSECAEDALGWIQFLEEHDLNDQDAEQQSNRVAALCLCASNFEQLSTCKSSEDNGQDESPEEEVTSLYSCAPEESSSSFEIAAKEVQVAFDRRCSDLHSENSSESFDKFVSCWENPSEWLKNASAQVVDMEMQLKRLQNDVVGYETERDVENQAKPPCEVVELEARLQLNESPADQFTEPPQFNVVTFALEQTNEGNAVDLAELRQELQRKESVIAELTSEVESKEILIARMERNHWEHIQAEIGEITRQLKAKENKIIELTNDAKMKELEVADLERNLKAKMHLDVAEMTSHIQLIEAKFLELTSKLHSKDVEIADLEQNQKIVLTAKDQELSALREECLRSDAHLDEVISAAQTTELENLDRISNLEDLCRLKDYKISELKQELLALQAKINASNPLQSPAMLRGPRSFMYNSSALINECEVASSDSHEQDLSPPIMHRHVLRHFEDLQVTTSSKAELSLPHVEVSDDNTLAHELYHERRSTPPSPSSDEEEDSTDAKDSGPDLLDDKENQIRTDQRKLYVSKSSLNSTNRLQTLKPSNFNNMTTKPRRADPSRTSTATGVQPGPNRVRASMTFTSATNSKGGMRHSSKSVDNPVLLNKPTKLRRKVIISPRRVAQVGLKVVTSMPSNTYVNSMKVSTDQRSDVNPLVGNGVGRSKENFAIKRRRWAA
ncbi:uncharacterized protein [Physcomitrium patens]|uniref:Uncharacterized protein n=1 Tax=Physcomitrium patens TaxID=3218 RepID=A0A2K1JYK2_PHYPA|nr:uncharacterized protein LOC112287328 isoform X1 [Physcomitrium patens]PNR46600.1 hypothetical protein PHYPA_013719 [Physcomitrium patens]|eukprot:XP_024385996.1 uncharacterized protein LOC112287328 isoform X1 [Physcomitrella patens]